MTRPTKRSECPSRPCPFVGCRYHLYLDVDGAGQIHYARPDTDPLDGETCALDVAARGGVTVDELAALLGISAVAASIEIRAAIEAFRRELDSIDMRVYWADSARDGFESLGDGGYWRTGQSTQS